MRRSPALERLLAKAEGSPVGLPAALLSRAEEAAGGVGYWRRTRDAGAIERHYRRSLDLARTTGDPRPIAWGLYNLSFAYDFVPLSVSMADDSARARQLRLEALAAFRELDDSRGMAYALWGLGSPLSAELSVDQMRTYLREAVDRFRDADDAFGESWALISTGMLEATHGGLDEALPPIVAGGRLFDRDGDVSGQLVLIDALASLLSRAGDHRGAVRLDAASVAFRGRTGAAAPPIPLFRGPIATSREVLDGETIGAQERLAEGIDFPSILAAAARAADRGITALEREIEQLGRSTPDTSAALAGIDAT
jgi:hypothetical protein